MSRKNTLENKKIRREERASKKAQRESLQLAIDALSITSEERGEASGLVVAQSVLWTPEDKNA